MPNIGTYLFVAYTNWLTVNLFLLSSILQRIYYSLTDWNGLTSDFKLIGIQKLLRYFKKILIFTLHDFYHFIFTIGLVIGEIVIGILVG
ncbi:hypothetical protein ACTGJ5_07605 [Streptococcus suis]|uniref:hypothetical protein n=1 Tax=Streptococcus suis TaxID=1307 RepID=UPI00403DEBC9